MDVAEKSQIKNDDFSLLDGGPRYSNRHENNDDKGLERQVMHRKAGADDSFWPRSRPHTVAEACARIRHRAPGNLRTDQHWSTARPQTRTAHIDTRRRLAAVPRVAARDQSEIAKKFLSGR